MEIRVRFSHRGVEHEVLTWVSRDNLEDREQEFAVREESEKRDPVWTKGGQELAGSVISDSRDWSTDVSLLQQ